MVVTQVAFSLTDFHPQVERYIRRSKVADPDRKQLCLEQMQNGANEAPVITAFEQQSHYSHLAGQDSTLVAQSDSAALPTASRASQTPAYGTSVDEVVTV